ncbi:MAG: hypothetical protein WCH01_08010 [Methylococcaceae bacterium]
MSGLAFEIGFDHYRFNLPLDISRFYDNDRQQIRDGYEAAETLNVSRRKPDRYEKKLISLRDRALMKDLELSITTTDLRTCFEETRGICPITQLPFTFAENTETDWSVDRVDNSRGYCSDNIVIVSVIANQAKSDLDLSGIIKQSLRPPNTEGLITSAQWLRMARFYYPRMKITRPLSMCLILTDFQPLYDHIVFVLLYKNESKNAKAIIKHLKKYITTDAVLKAAKLTQKRVHQRTKMADDLLYGSPKLYGMVQSFINAINAHSSEFDPLLMDYLFESQKQ